nr:MgtC/SapB family protein [Tessaracoccus coleopterorum]
MCAIIGMERQFQHKSAGIKTHALVGLGSCVFTLISVEGFVYLAEYQVTRDPSRIAAQIVSGIGFLGAGLIFVNRDVVRGLTTAASIWLSAAIGMACGSGLIPLAILATLLHFVSAVVFPPLARILPRRATGRPSSSRTRTARVCSARSSRRPPPSDAAPRFSPRSSAPRTGSA